MTARLRYWSVFVLGGLFLFALFYRLDFTPWFWWDEGWTASAARNWAEIGHYGRLSLGERTIPGLEATLPLTGAVALAFKWFGIGLTQARAVVGIYLVATLVLFFYLARRFYNRDVALGACLGL